MLMDYSSQVLSESSGFGNSHYVNLKLKSPSPSPFQDDSHTVNNFILDPLKEEMNFEESTSLESSTIKDHEKIITKLDIYKTVLGLTAGKDRLAKTIYYILNLIKYYLINTRRFLISEKFENLSISPLQHYKTPIKYIKLLIFLNSTNFEKKITILTKNISFFRYALRFGGTPYRLNLMLNKLFNFYKVPTIDSFKEIFLNETFLSDFINFYYGIVDELVLICDLGVINHKPLRKFAGRHIDLAWFYEILLSLKQNYVKFNENKSKQLQLNIQYEVRKKASQLSKKLISNINSSPLRQEILKEFNPKNSISNLQLVELKELKHQEDIIKLDLFRLSMDLVMCSDDVFGFKFHRLIYLSVGLFSGISGLSKVWINTKKDLLEK